MLAMCVNNIKYSVYFSNRRNIIWFIANSDKLSPCFFIFDPITLVYAGAWSYNAICIYGFDKKCV